MKEFFDDWYGLIAVIVFILGLTIGLSCFVNWALIHDLKVDLKSYQDFHECVISGVDYVVCEIHFLE